MSDVDRKIARILHGEPAHTAEGYLVYRPFPSDQPRAFDPFLAFDEIGPLEHIDVEAIGSPVHPHRGVEIVTYMLDGQLRYDDTRGHRGLLGAGDVQWLTAGAGIMHSEIPHCPGGVDHGHIHGFKLWVRLPERCRFVKPHYQDFRHYELPTLMSADRRTRVRVIAGKALGKRAPLRTFSPLCLLHLSLLPGGVHKQYLPADWRAFAYVISGAGTFGADAQPVSERQMVEFGTSGERVTLAVPQEAPEPLDVLLLAGAPLGEESAKETAATDSWLPESELQPCYCGGPQRSESD
jgi:redox-sensitive bicupin YhaK (pirin superfamily)